MIFVDPSVLIGYFNGAALGQIERLDFLSGREICVIRDYVLTEALQGFKND